MGVNGQALVGEYTCKTEVLSSFTGVCEWSALVGEYTCKTEVLSSFTGGCEWSALVGEYTYRERSCPASLVGVNGQL